MSPKIIDAYLGFGIFSSERKTSDVLSPFKKKFHQDVELVLNNSIDAINFLIDNNINDTMNKYNIKNKRSN